MKPIKAKTYSSEAADAAWKIHYANALVEYIRKSNDKYHQYATREASTILYNKLNSVVSNEVRRHVLPLRIFTEMAMFRR